MDRVQELRELLESSQYFKLVCGAGNENVEEVRRLSLIYTLAGANAFDVSANPEVVKACLLGIEKAYFLADQFNIKIKTRPFVNVSIGLPGDHHVRKATINLEKCIHCLKCISVCPTDAISNNLLVDRKSCIGCGHCGSVCPSKGTPISYEHNALVVEEILPKCLAAGAETIELHAAIGDNSAIFEEWSQVKKINPHHFISMCLDRANLSNASLKERVKGASQIGGNLTIIQADGVPMSGGSDDFKTTLQTVAIAEVLQNEFFKEGKQTPFYMLLSGGTNGQTAELAHLCGIRYHGLALGTHARKIIKKFITSDKFEETYSYLCEPVAIATDLVTKREMVLKKYGKNLS